MLEKKYFIELYGRFSINEIARHRESFGWKTITIEGSKVHMERQIENMNSELKVLENIYDNAQNIYRMTYKDSSWEGKDYFLMILLTMFYIFPGIIYFNYKKKQKIHAENQVITMIQAYEKALKLEYKVIND